MEKIIKISIAFLVLVTGFIFGPNVVKAALPVEAGLGQTCDAATSCESRFYCSGGKCVQCIDDLECDTSINESCVNNVCTIPSGNNAGDLCAKDSNCKSGLTCGAKGICEETGGGGFKKAFNYSCGSTADCASGLSCSGGKCVQCATKSDCAGNVSACDQNVCVLTGGNPEGAWCTKGAQCVSGKCSDSNRCLAGTSGGAGTTASNSWMGIDLTIQDVANIINGIACWLTRIATAIMVIFLILAGLRFMNARGDPAKWTAAKKNFQYVLIGILVIMAIYVIIATVANAVGRTDFSLIPLVC